MINKFNIGDKLYYYVLADDKKLVHNIVVNKITEKPDAVYYEGIGGGLTSIKEDYLFKSRKECYSSLLARAENESKSPDGK